MAGSQPPLPSAACQPEANSGSGTNSVSKHEEAENAAPGQVGAIEEDGPDDAGGQRQGQRAGDEEEGVAGQTRAGGRPRPRRARPRGGEGVVERPEERQADQQHQQRQERHTPTGHKGSPGQADSLEAAHSGS